MTTPVAWFSHSWAFLQELSCMLQVDLSRLNRYSLFYNCEKIVEIIDGVYFIPKAAVCKVKKAPAK